MANKFVSLEYLNINTDCILKKSGSNNNYNAKYNAEYKYNITKISENLINK